MSDSEAVSEPPHAEIDKPADRISESLVVRLTGTIARKVRERMAKGMSATIAVTLPFGKTEVRKAKKEARV